MGFLNHLFLDKHELDNTIWHDKAMKWAIKANDVSMEKYLKGQQTGSKIMLSLAQSTNDLLTVSSLNTSKTSVYLIFVFFYISLLRLGITLICLLFGKK